MAQLASSLDNNTDRRAILDALLAALPESRMIQVRTPMHVEGAFPGGPISPADAFNGSPRARLGHHNDCLLASASDMGTYQSPVDQWRSYVADDGRFTPFGGETCAVNAPRTDCSAALAELEMLHGSYVNSEYHGGVLDGWAAQGCEGEISQRLGYRFVIKSAQVSSMDAPGGVLRVRIEVASRASRRRSTTVRCSWSSTTASPATPPSWPPSIRAAGRRAESVTSRPTCASSRCQPGSYRLALRLPTRRPTCTTTLATRSHGQQDIWDSGPATT